jgi:AcrR family transcriptional regulator
VFLSTIPETQVLRLESLSIPEYCIAVFPTTQAPDGARAGARDGLRSRKKERTRRAIEDAALDLFAERGYEDTTVDEIAERAEVSKATFFRYFGTKGEVIFGDTGEQHEGLRRAIVERPSDEDDVTAVRRALQHDWTGTLDPDRTARQARAASTSPLLRGLSFDLGMKWQTAISRALAERHGLDVPDRRCWLVAGISFAALSNAVNSWMYLGATDDLAEAIDDAFALLGEIGRAITPSPPPSR